MGHKRTFFRFSISILLVLPLIFSIIKCSTPSWFPIKTGAPHKANTKELRDKEVVIIDEQEYVKIYNPKPLGSEDHSKYLYIPVDEYLSKKGSFVYPTAEVGNKKEVAVSTSKPSPSSIEGESFSRSLSISVTPDLKRKVMIAYFSDQTTNGEETLGDWVTEKLTQEVNRNSQGIIIIDYQGVKEFLEKRGVALTDLEKPNILSLLNEVFGLQALIVGELSGPYTFTKAEKGQEDTASAIIKLEIRIVDTSSGKTFKTLSAQNPVVATKEKGAFSGEKAAVKAIDFAVADLSQSLTKELDGLDWFCRIAKVEGNEVYINAGRLTGLKVGDVMEVFHPGEPGERGEVKGEIQISACFGIDASMGRLINGKKPDVNDILKFVKRGET